MSLYPFRPKLFLAKSLAYLKSSIKNEASSKAQQGDAKSPAGSGAMLSGYLTLLDARLLPEVPPFAEKLVQGFTSSAHLI